MEANNHIEEKPYYRRCLEAELARRVENNPKYSVRGFARALQVDPSILSRVLRGKRSLSYPTARRIADRLNLSPEERVRFYRSIAGEKQELSVRKIEDGSPVREREEYAEIDTERFRIISAWYHYAILDLTRVEDFRSSPRWIAQRLGISALEASLAVERLLKLGLLRQENGRLIKTAKNISTQGQGLRLQAVRKHQRQQLEKACHSLENDPEEKRMVMGITMAIDPSKIPVAKVRIQQFCRELSEYLETGRQKRVYRIQAALFPLDRPADAAAEEPVGPESAPQPS